MLPSVRWRAATAHEVSAAEEAAVPVESRRDELFRLWGKAARGFAGSLHRSGSVIHLRLFLVCVSRRCGVAARAVSPWLGLSSKGAFDSLHSGGSEWALHKGACKFVSVNGACRSDEFGGGACCSRSEFRGVSSMALFLSRVWGDSSLLLLRPRRSKFAFGVFRREESPSKPGLLLSAVPFQFSLLSTRSRLGRGSGSCVEHNIPAPVVFSLRVAPVVVLFRLAAGLVIGICASPSKKRPLVGEFGVGVPNSPWRWAWYPGSRGVFFHGFARTARVLADVWCFEDSTYVGGDPVNEIDLFEDGGSPQRCDLSLTPRF
ncbi:hypothetical protein YC2023_106941 [Brassica napus]